MSPTHQDLSNDTTFSQIKSRVPVPLTSNFINILQPAAEFQPFTTQRKQWWTSSINNERFEFKYLDISQNVKKQIIKWNGTQF